jgi:phospholipid transport system substrate-binding protein
MTNKILGRAIAIGLVVLFLLSTLTPASAATGGPTEQARASADQIIALLQDRDLDLAERNRRITELVKANFDFTSMAQAVLGPQWRNATPEQRQRFIDLFSELLEATYRGRLEAYTDDYAGEQVQYVQETIKGDRAQVDTIVVTRTARIPINFRMIEDQDQWRVYDVVIEGVSLIRNYRGTYDEILRKEGFDGLFARMESKTKELRQTGSAVSP